MSTALINAAAPSMTRHEPLRVMVVDDSVVIRGMISRWIDAEPDMEVSASLRTGLDAVNQIERIKPDVAVLDIEMPELDGISALPQLLAKKHGLDADPPQRGDQLQGAFARRGRLHSKPGKHARGQRGRDLPPRSDSEDPSPGRQGTPADVARCNPVPRAGPRAGPRSNGPPRRCTGAAGATGAPAFRHAGAAGAADRIVDRRPAGADDAGRRHRSGYRSFSGADHPAHAA